MSKPSQLEQLDRFSTLVHECPFVYIRSDSIRILWDHCFPNEKLEVNAAALLKHDPGLELVKTPDCGQKTPLGAIQVKEKVKYLQRNPPQSIRNRVKFLGSPSNYLFEHFHYLYTRVYGAISESVLRQHLAEVCHAKDANEAKFALPKDLWTCGVKWPDWCHGESTGRSSPRQSLRSVSSSPGGAKSGAAMDDGGDFIEIPDDWEDVLTDRSDLPVRSVPPQLSRSPSSHRLKRARRDLGERLGGSGHDWGEDPDRMDVDCDNSERSISDYTDSRPSTPTQAASEDVLSIDLLPKMTARRVLNAILERASARGGAAAGNLNRRDQIDADKDQTRSVDKHAERFMAHDFFQLKSRFT